MIFNKFNKSWLIKALLLQNYNYNNNNSNNNNYTNNNKNFNQNKIYKQVNLILKIMKEI